MISIIGNGKMALAIAKGLKNNIEVVGRDEEKLKKFSEITGAKYYLLNDFDITNKTIILATKPYSLESLNLKGKAKEVISIMAGKKNRRDKKIYRSRSL
jgi:pyrroline-5-carboxylate reductase